MVQSSPGVISTCSESTTSRTRSVRIRWECDPQNWQPERPWGIWSRESGEISLSRRAYTRPYVALRTFVGIEPMLSRTYLLSVGAVMISGGKRWPRYGDSIL